MSPKTIRLSQKAKDRLIALKRRTGIDQWNVLCRWALCRSLQEPTDPPQSDIVTDSNIEIAWSTFAGEYSQLYAALLTSTQTDDEGEQDNILAHIHRGIDYLFSEIGSDGSITDVYRHLPTC